MRLEPWILFQGGIWILREKISARNSISDGRLMLQISVGNVYEIKVEYRQEKVQSDLTETFHTVYQILLMVPVRFYTNPRVVQEPSTVAYVLSHWCFMKIGNVACPQKRGPFRSWNSLPTSISAGDMWVFRGVSLFAGDVFIGILQEASKWLVAKVWIPSTPKNQQFLVCQETGAPQRKLIWTNLPCFRCYGWSTVCYWLVVSDIFYFHPYFGEASHFD